MAEAPRVFHFVFGLRPQDAPFHLAHYLALESCRRLNDPAAIFLHYRHLPWGPWWDRIAPHLALRAVGDAPAGYDPARYADTAEGRLIALGGWAYAHEADFIRLDVLLEHGGVYADIDTLFVRRYPDALFHHECALGEEPPVAGPAGVRRPSLCNAVIAARPGAAFLRRWRERGAEAFDGTWSRHSCEEASRLWTAGGHPVHVLPRASFYRFGPAPVHLRALFEESAPDRPDCLSLHLWSHLWWDERRTDFSRFHAGLLTEDYVAGADTTYARLARRFLPRPAPPRYPTTISPAA